VILIDFSICLYKVHGKKRMLWVCPDQAAVQLAVGHTRGTATDDAEWQGEMQKNTLISFDAHVLLLMATILLVQLEVHV
jgi:hypothetical protein